MVSTDNNISSEDNSNDSLCECSMCHEQYDENEMYHIDQSDEIVCDDCFSDNVSTCCECDETFISDEGYNHDYCSQSCWSEYHTTCVHCGDELHIDDAYCSRNDEYCCEQCYQDYERNYLTENDEYDFKFLTTDSKTKIDTKGFTIGVEIETINENDLTKFEVDDYLKINVDTKEDGSLYGNGVEFVTNPASNDEFHKLVSQLCNYLNDNDFTIHSCCGLHIHIGHENEGLLDNPENRHKIMMFYSLYNDTIYNMLNPERRFNRYTNEEDFSFNPLIFVDKIDDNPEKLFDKRYNTINYRAWRKHHTLEIRAHEGTTSAHQIFMWAKINIQLFLSAINLNREQIIKLKGTEKEFVSFLKYPELKQYYLKRKHYFKVKLKRGRKPEAIKVMRKKMRYLKDIYSPETIEAIMPEIKGY